METSLSVQLARLLEALSTEERIALYQQHPAIQGGVDTLRPDAEDLERVDRYINNENPHRQASLSQTLQEASISPETYRLIASNAYLGLLAATLSLPAFPTWVSTLCDLYSQDYPTGERYSAMHRQNVDLAQFFDPFEAIIRKGRKQLKANIARATGDFATWHLDYDYVEHQLLHDISFTLFDMVDRVMVLELNIAKMQEELQGDSPAARFQDFIRQKCSPEQLISLLEDYPLLFRKIHDFVMQWAEVSAETALRLNADIGDIEEHFGISDASKIKKLHINAGDKHCGNRTVVIITYADGGKVVYKPRSLAVDRHFQQYLDWYNSIDDTLPLKIMKILDRGSYGYAEFIDHQHCQSEEELQRYYGRIGSLLALLYIIKATDFHHENIIARGEHPVLIDLESLFHSVAVKGYDPIDERVNSLIQNSVLNIQLLPFKIYYGGKAVDISGISNTEGAEAPAPVPAWQAEATDEMKLTRVNARLAGAKNAPIAQGANNTNLLQYGSVIRAAFIRSYHLLMEHREALLAGDSVIRAFAQDDIRLLVRPTSAYTAYLRGSFHSDYLQSYLYRHKLQDYLWDKAKVATSFAYIVPAEIRATEQKDVPFFSTRAGGRDLYADGQLIAKDYFEEAGMEASLHRIATLSEEDCMRQAWFIDASMATTLQDNESISWQDRSYLPPVQEDQRLSPEKAQKTSQFLADRIDTLHLQVGEYSHWASLILSDGSSYDIKSLMMDTYSGLPGVALFLAASYSTRRDPRDKALLTGTLHNIKRLADRYTGMQFTARMGAYDGWAGLAWCLYQIAALMESEQIRAFGKESLDFTLNHIDEVRGYDVLSGAAGVILALHAIQQQAADERIPAAMLHLGEKIMAAAEKTNDGYGWINTGGSKPLAGFGHGAAGIAAALAVLEQYKPDAARREVIEGALAFESSLFDPRTHNWRDVREAVLAQQDDDNPLNMVGWCHGASGVGMGRIILLQHMEHEGARRDLLQAVETVLAQGFGRNHSLCHGDMGNLDFLYAAAAFLGDDALRENTDALALAVHASITEGGFVSGIANGVENPGLMTGIAGAGYEACRQAAPGRIPSVLMLQS